MAIGREMYSQHIIGEALSSSEWRKSRNEAIKVAKRAINTDCYVDFPDSGLVEMVLENQQNVRKLFRYCSLTKLIPWYVAKWFAPNFK